MRYFSAKFADFTPCSHAGSRLNLFGLEDGTLIRPFLRCEENKNTMNENEHDGGSDAVHVLEYLRRRPNDFVSEVEISRQADSETRYLADQNWAQRALSRLLDLHMAETDGSRNYRLKITTGVVGKGPAKKFISPQIKILLTQNGLKIDPERYA